MKLFQSHKQVNAARINSCGFEPDGSGWIQYTDTDGEEVQYDAPRGFLRPGMACEPGDYLVRYQPDGYLSWSPRAVFEAGYTIIKEARPGTGNPAPGNVWQSRAMDELEELGDRLNLLRHSLLNDAIPDDQVKALMQAQHKAMTAYHDALSMRLRVCGVIGTETPPTVWDVASGPLVAALPPEMRGTPACVEVTVTAPAGKRAEVIHGRGEQQTAFTVTEGQSQSWSVMNGERVTVRSADTSTVAHKRPAG
jgi:hypothetical protein